MPKLYIIAGCNGAGKTTTSYTVLPEILNCDNWLVYDNSFESPEIIAIGQSGLTNTIYNYNLWGKFEITK